MSDLLETFPGIASAKFMWIDGDGKRRDMIQMDYAYLKNARKHIARFIAESNTNRERFLLDEKINQFDTALRILSQKIRLNKIPPTVAEKTSLKDFGMSRSHLYNSDE